MSSTPLMEIENLKVHFPIRGGVFLKQVGNVFAVDGVNLTINQGETVGLVGESGCGKSTFGKAILKLIKSTDGNIFFEGSDLSHISHSQMREYRKDLHLTSFPQTFRVVGPNSNTAFRDYLTYNNMYLVSYHPITKELVPGMATHWAFGKDRKTVYYKLDQRAKWSDGRPVTAHDYLYILKLMRSPHINAPWYNNYYSTEIADIKAYGPYTIAIVTGNEKPQDELINTTAVNPLPSHFYKLDESWEKNYNWAIVPNTGPYEITEYKKGSYIIMERKKDWWAANDKYYKYRFNVDRVVFKVIRSEQIAYIHFKKQELDSFSLTRPKWWHVKAKGDLYDNGLIHKRWFFVTVPEGVGGLFMNVSHPILKDLNVRKGIAHAINMEGMIKDVLKGLCSAKLCNRNNSVNSFLWLF